MAVASLPGEFPGGVEAGVDLPPQCPGCLGKREGQFDHFDGTDDEQINVAAGSFRATGNGTINGRHLDFGGQGCEFAMKDINQARRFDQQGAQFRENRAFLVRLKIGAVSIPGHLEDADGRKLRQITLQGGWPDAKMVCQFHRVNRLMRIQKQGGQQPLLGAGKENAGNGCITHYAYNKTHIA